MNSPFSDGKATMFYKTSRLTDRAYNAIRRNMRSLTTGLILSGAMGLTACVQVSAPDKPIVINLNINIKQEVVYRLDGDAKDLINEEADIF
ncbi:YnbE-like lipoprotein [Parasphingorhabdus marina DSM 22363]|uniref:YnbE-like lipoprotein n=2 Tax=Parasphingorhabdus marina TaxID=394732 RepID=A0A1N6G6C7_9SPHN|nr:YnbE-like lipoprotein [Parasphingorhabdus marina DSM 22363]